MSWEQWICVESFLEMGFLKRARRSSQKIFDMYLDYRKKDFVGMDMCRKFLEMGFTRNKKITITKTVKIW